MSFVRNLGLREIFILFFLSMMLLGVRASGQSMEKITEIKIVYWRAFHGTIEQYVGKDASGKMYMATYLYRSENQEDRKQESISKDVSQEVLNRIVEFVNDREVRKSFSKSEPFVQPDGSRIEMTVRENSFGFVFVSQTAFNSTASESDRRLGVIVVDMIRRAGIDIPKEDQY